MQGGCTHKSLVERDEVQGAIKKLKIEKALGIHGTPADMMKYRDV